MNPRAIPSNALPHPAAVYSQAILAGDVVYVAGQPGVEYQTGALSGDFETQARQAFRNLELVLHAAGSGLHKVVKTTVWLTDAGNFDTMNKLYNEFFPTNPPARSTPVVGLPKPNLLISIEAIALVGR